MSAIDQNEDDVIECPLCMEPLEVDDISFFPCTCGYQVFYAMLFFSFCKCV